MAQTQPAENHRFVHFQVPADLHDALKVLSDVEGRTVAAELRHLIRCAVKRTDTVSELVQELKQARDELHLANNQIMKLRGSL